ncbi:hypothetical protein BLOT_006732 [Blomia tropicalis]|nr:hypothetical protein BLOT_006732 [Blomia tropicalis]
MAPNGDDHDDPSILILLICLLGNCMEPIYEVGFACIALSRLALSPIRLTSWHIVANHPTKLLPNQYSICTFSLLSYRVIIHSFFSSSPELFITSFSQSVSEFISSFLQSSFIWGYIFQYFGNVKLPSYR